MTLPPFSSTDLILQLPDVLRIFLAVWLLSVGGCVGSFLNVVVLRLPAGIGIARSGSRCPVCLHPIRWYDNIPAISWLVLRGRCRDCRTPISARYPIVEVLVALIFLAVGYPEVLAGGANLPLPANVSSHFSYPPFEYWSLYVFHMAGLVTVLAAALIERDRHQVPPRLFIPTVLSGLVAPVILPFLHPVSGVTSLGATWLGGLVSVVCGLIVGAILGAAAWPATNAQPWRPKAPATAVLAAGLMGLVLGWQAITAVLLVTSLAFLLSSIVGCFLPLGRSSWCSHLAVVSLAWVIGWRAVTDAFPILAGTQGWWLVGVAGVAIFLVSLITAWYAPAREYVQQADLEERKVSTSADREANLQAILKSPSYLPVEYDAEFLQQWETRPVRVQLELLKPEIGLAAEGVESTIVVFGGTQVVDADDAAARMKAAKTALEQSPNDPDCKRAVARLERIMAKAKYYEAARDFGKLVSSNCQIDGKCDYVIVTGGGPGIMEAANRGAYEVGAKSIGLNITLPAEQVPNPYITPNLCFQFHYFALRKMHFLLRAKAMLVFPGGFGTLDELFDALTLRQTKRMQEIPIILFGRDFWQQVVDFQFLADEGVIADRDLELLNFAETPEEAWRIITSFHSQREGIQDL